MGSNLMAWLLLGVGVVTLLVGAVLSVRVNLVGTLAQGLNGGSENAVIFLVIGVVCLFAGFFSKR